MYTLREMRCCAVLVFGGLLALAHCLPMTLLEKANPMGLHLNKVGDIWANCCKFSFVFGLASYVATIVGIGSMLA